MTFIDILYYLTIGPLELFFEVVYMLAYRVIGSPSLAIIALSLAMNFLVLPLYRRADAMQEEERQTEERLGAGVRHIKAAFRGDERMMILQTYYRQNHYKQSYVLRGSLPLLLEIPFFIAAYRFLSGLEILQGVSFGPIADLGAPDGLLVISGIAINLLPVLMTAINIISSSIYADHMSRKTRIQLYVMAAIFLVFLYQSPAGLVFYWTLNNLFSLVKNICYKLPNPRKVLRILAMLVGAVAVGYIGIAYQTPSILRKSVLISAAALLFAVPLMLTIIERRTAAGSSQHDNHFSLGRYLRDSASADQVSPSKLFIISELYLTILIGGLIPSAVIGSSPEDFLSYSVRANPMNAIVGCLCLAAGYFLVWAGVFYGLASERYRYKVALIMVAFSIIATLDYFVFKPDSRSGVLSTSFAYENGLVIDRYLAFVGIAVSIAVMVFVIIVSRRNTRLLRYAMQTLCVVILVMSTLNIITIHNVVSNFYQRADAMDDREDEPEITLSENGNNVVVLVLDRAIGAYMPYILAERPDLMDIFDGFVYYPNTLSYGGGTVFGAPGMVGGYEYTTAAMNERSDERLVDKHNEALLTMPVLFSNEGFDVTVCEPPYAGYLEQGDYSIYDDYPGITAIQTEGRTESYKEQVSTGRQLVRPKKIFAYSVVRITPLLLQKPVYNGGLYNMSSSMDDQLYIQEYQQTGYDKSKGCRDDFLRAYYVLTDLEEMTRISKNEKGSYVFLNNNTVHNAQLLQEPSYTPAYEVDNTEYDETHIGRFTVDGVTSIMNTHDKQMTHYESMMAALIQIGEWLDYLRDHDLYDNTRIIIVSDHSYNVGSFSDRYMSNGTEVLRYNPLLMVKDYDAHGFETSEEFMTNADVPYLSVEGIIENPVNPFTGNKITNEAKNGPQYVLNTAIYNQSDRETQFPVDEWLSVEGDVRDANNWKVVSKGTALPY